jgi:hypothetical protein
MEVLDETPLSVDVSDRVLITDKIPIDGRAPIDRTVKALAAASIELSPSVANLLRACS